MASSKISDLVPPVKEKRRQTQVTGTMEMEMKKVGSGRPRERPRAPQILDITPSAQQAMQA